MKEHTLEEVRAAKSHALEIFGKLAQVAGVGITRSSNGYALKVNLTQSPTRGAALPCEVNVVPVKTEIVGPIRKRG